MKSSSATRISPSRRSEEHTSELQSRPHLVCRLLLEKTSKLEVVYTAKRRSDFITGASTLDLCRGLADDIDAYPFDPFFFFNDTATTEIYTLSLHDALPI